jgi:hypothetical protein
LFGLDLVCWRALKDIALNKSKVEEKIAFGIATSGIMKNYKGLPPSTTPLQRETFIRIDKQTIPKVTILSILKMRL